MSDARGTLCEFCENQYHAKVVGLDVFTNGPEARDALMGYVNRRESLYQALASIPAEAIEPLAKFLEAQRIINERLLLPADPDQVDALVEAVREMELAQAWSGLSILARALREPRQ